MRVPFSRILKLTTVTLFAAGLPGTLGLADAQTPQHRERRRPSIHEMGQQRGEISEFKPTVRRVKPSEYLYEAPGTLIAPETLIFEVTYEEGRPPITLVVPPDMNSLFKVRASASHLGPMVGDGLHGNPQSVNTEVTPDSVSCKFDKLKVEIIPFTTQHARLFKIIDTACRPESESAPAIFFDVKETETEKATTTNPKEKRKTCTLRIAFSDGDDMKVKDPSPISCGLWFREPAAYVPTVPLSPDSDSAGRNINPSPLSYPVQDGTGVPAD